MTLTIYVKPEDKLPDNATWTNRFQIRSQSSNRIYIIAQGKTNRIWKCSCPGNIRYGYCKHMRTLNIPAGRPFEANLGSR